MKVKTEHNTVKHRYSENAYNELKLTAKRFSFPVSLLHVVIWMDVTNYAYNEVKMPILDTLLLACFTVHLHSVFTIKYM